MTERRIASIWLPALAIEYWAKSADCALDSPVVLTVEGTHGPIIHAVTKAAAERGARAGARLTDARALDPALVALAADPDGDAALLKRLARWAGRWSPLVEVDGDDALRLDVSGVAHLFGGERRLVGDIEKRFAAAGFTVRIAIAPTASAAWALARYAPAICTRGNVGAKLADLPVAALRLPPEAVRTLERLGLKTIGTLAGIERRSLARRFREADNPVDALDRALGRKPEPLTAIAEDAPPVARLRLEEPATHPEAAAQALERLVPLLVRQLEERHLGARRLTLRGFRVDGSVGQASVATAIASREPKHLQRLLSDKAALLDPEFGFDAFALTAEWTERLMSAQDSLVEQPGGEQDLARLVDRLTVKLGPERVRRPVAEESHLPERASGWGAAVSSLRGAKATKQSKDVELDCFAPLAMTAPRPHHLLDRPEAIDVIYATPEGMPRRFVWRRSVHDIARAAGPERIAPEWWREPSTARLCDYYRVEDTSGRRFWIYREGVIGDGRGGVPNWFMHGLFG
jgi:protein ImuB